MTKKILMLLAVTMFSLTLILWIILPSELNLNLLVSAISLLFVIGYLISYRTHLLTFISKRYTKKISSEMTTISLITLIILVINVMIHKSDISWDITTGGDNTLSDQTQVLLSQLEAPLDITVYASRNLWNESLKQWMTLVAAQSRRVQYQYKDIDTELALVNQKQIQKDGTIELNYQGRSVYFIFNKELSLVNALIKLYSNQDYKIGIFLQSDFKDFQFLIERLKSQSYGVTTITTLANLEQYQLLIIPRLSSDLTPSQISLLENFQTQGGSLLLSVNPLLSQGGGIFPHLDKYLQNRGIQWINGVVLDRLSSIKNLEATHVLTRNFGKHAITDRFKEDLVFPLASPLLVKPEVAEFQNSTLVSSANFPATWGETNLGQLKSGSVRFDDQDLKGPVSLVVASNSIQDNSRLLVLGSSLFFSDQSSSYTHNFNFLLNSISWLLSQESVMAINRPSLERKPIFINVAEFRLGFILYVLMIPGFLLALSFIKYRKRKNA